MVEQSKYKNLKINAKKHTINANYTPTPILGGISQPRFFFLNLFLRISDAV